MARCAPGCSCDGCTLAMLHRERSRLACFDLSLTLVSDRFSITQKALRQTVSHAIAHEQAATVLRPLPRELLS